MIKFCESVDILHLITNTIDRLLYIRLYTGRIRHIFLLVSFLPIFVYSAEEHLCLKEKAYLDEINSTSGNSSNHSCAISYEEFKNSKGHFAILVGMPDVAVKGMLNIEANELAEIVSLKGSRPVLIGSGLNSAEFESYFCSKLFRLNPDIRVLKGGIQSLPLSVPPYISLNAAARAIINNSAVIYDDGSDTDLPVIVTANYVDHYKSSKQRERSSQGEVFFTKTFKDELNKHVAFLRQTTNRKKAIPARYSCK